MAEKKKKKKKKFIQDAIKRPGAFTAKAEKKGITSAHYKRMYYPIQMIMMNVL